MYVMTCLISVTFVLLSVNLVNGNPTRDEIIRQLLLQPVDSDESLTPNYAEEKFEEAANQYGHRQGMDTVKRVFCPFHGCRNGKRSNVNRDPLPSEPALQDIKSYIYNRLFSDKNVQSPPVNPAPKESHVSKRLFCNFSRCGGKKRSSNYEKIIQRLHQKDLNDNF